MNTTGKLDKLIEDKVDQKIDKFARDITEQIKQFLKDNGDYSGDYLYQAQGFELYNQEYRPINYAYNKLYGCFFKNIKGGLQLTIKDKMIERETKDLLAKVELLS
jgi:hypothetical protein